MIEIEECDASVFSTQGTNKGRFEVIYPFKFMDAGQYFKVESDNPEYTATKIRNAYTYYSIKYKAKFSTRIVGNEVFVYKTQGDKQELLNTTKYELFKFSSVPKKRSGDVVKNGITDALLSLEVGKSIKISFNANSRFKDNAHLAQYVRTCVYSVVKSDFNGEAIFKTKRIDKDSKVAIMRQK